MALDRVVSVRPHHSHHPDAFELSTDQLKAAVEARYGGTATFARWVLVTGYANEIILWNQFVGIFELAGHPHAIRAYAWSSAVEGGDERRFHAVLHAPKTSSPAWAVRAVMAGLEPRIVTVGPEPRAAARETPDQMHDRHIAEQERRIEQQQDRIAQLARAGVDTAAAERFLASMQEFLRVMQSGENVRTGDRRD